MAVGPSFKPQTGQNWSNGMRPMAVLIGIITGSAVAMTVSLTMSAIVFFLLPEYSVRLAPERLPLLKGLLWSWSLAAVGGASFVGELRHWRWRYAAQLVLAAMLLALGIIYWP
jgi:predicted membrane protein